MDKIRDALEIGDGKYTIVFSSHGGLKEILRYGEPWLESPVPAANLFLAMAYKIREQAEALAALDRPRVSDEGLRSENLRLREALASIHNQAAHQSFRIASVVDEVATDVRKMARAALGGQSDE